jgi:hypothetical protein
VRLRPGRGLRPDRILDRALTRTDVALERSLLRVVEHVAGREQEDGRARTRARAPASSHYRACVVAVLAAAATACSLATARAAIRATKAHVPTLAGPNEPPEPANPALADRVACAGLVIAVSISSGGTAGDTSWLAFVRGGSAWRVVKSAGGYKLGLFAHRGEIEIVQPVYRAHDPNCCPTGGFDRTRYRFDGNRLVVTRHSHTRRFQSS